MNKAMTFVELILSWLSYLISLFIPRDKKIWVFNGWFKNNERQTFADNSKYVFLHASNFYKDKIRPIWIGEDKEICKILNKHGYEAYSIRSVQGTYFSLRAGITVTDAIFKLPNWRLSGGSKIIQLWHADGIKKLSQTYKWSPSNIKKVFMQPGNYTKFSFHISSSAYISEKFTAPSFDIPIQNVKVTGLPRYDTFFREISGHEIDLHTELQETITNIKKRNCERLMLYAPTFRRGKSLNQQLSPLNFQILNEFLRDKNFFLVVSLHPKFSAENWVPETKYSNIYFVNPGYDVYPLLKEFDLVITDYSSICIDFLMLNKPSIFYVYDIDEYRKREGLAEEFWNYMPGLRVHSYDELIDALSKNYELLLDNLDVRKTIFKYTDGGASERVLQEILKLKINKTEVTKIAKNI